MQGDSGELFVVQKNCQKKWVNFRKRKMPMKPKAGNMPETAQKILSFVSVV